MRKDFFWMLLSLILAGCAHKVEVPNGHVGVVKKHRQVTGEILEPGQYVLEVGSNVVLFNVDAVSLTREFEFVFSDASSGFLKLYIRFVPISNSLPEFYKKYQTTAAEMIVDVEMRQIVRELLLKYKPTDFSKNELNAKILKVITSDQNLLK